MSRFCFPSVCLVGLLISGNAVAFSAEPAKREPVTLENVQAPQPNQLDEPLAKEFSLDKAVDFLDSAALNWQKQRQCFTCHTNYAFLYARPLVSSTAPVHATVRGFAEELVEKRWVEKGPRWDAEVIATAAALAANDALTTGKLHPTTRQALDKMWTLQRENGGWTWLKCGWPPMESDDHYGACLAAVAVSVAPENYRQTDVAKAGIAKLKEYLAKNPSPTLHHSAMLLWASSYGTDFLTPEQQQATRDKLIALQQADGGWSLPTLGDWKRDDKSPQSEVSDGYGTGFVIFVLRRTGLPATDARLQKGVVWLKNNQRESGRWITRSLKKDGHHFISHAGTAFAIMAIKSCEAPATAAVGMK
ncbi:MAG: hypothetical protein JWM11_3585 [Planctomycetaceae bacterium]|nr:hypothetical protein [Planctomycetaceae bacterium]